MSFVQAKAESQLSSRLFRGDLQMMSSCRDSCLHLKRIWFDRLTSFYDYRRTGMLNYACKECIDHCLLIWTNHFVQLPWFVYHLRVYNVQKSAKPPGKLQSCTDRFFKSLKGNWETNVGIDRISVNYRYCIWVLLWTICSSDWQAVILKHVDNYGALFFISLVCSLFSRSYLPQREKLRFV